MKSEEKERLKKLFSIKDVGGGVFSEGFCAALEVAEERFLRLGGCEHIVPWDECYLVCSQCWQDKTRKKEKRE